MLVLALVLTQHDAFSVKATSMPMWAEMDKSRREAGDQRSDTSAGHCVHPEDLNMAVFPAAPSF